MSHLKNLKKFANILLQKRGHILIPEYELSHLLKKNREIVKEVMDYFFSIRRMRVPFDEKRMELLSELYGTGVIEALYLIFYLKRSLDLPGDICEFGVANGATSVLLAHEMRNTDKKLWLFDSFEGLSQPSKEDSLINDIFKLGSMSKYEGAMSYPSREVIERLQRIKFPKRRVKIVKGFIENTVRIKENLPKKIALVYIDFDLYSPIKISLLTVDALLVKGGVIIIDDYGFFSSGVKLAVDEFLAKKNYSFTLPSYSEGHFAILTKK